MPVRLMGWNQAFVLVALLTGTFAVASANGKQISISRQLLSITPAVTDYRAQAQTIEYCVADIGLPPSTIDALQCIHV